MQHTAPTEVPNPSSILLESPHAMGKLIREARKFQALTQEDLAGLTGLGTRFISELERGKATAQLEKAFLVLHTLGITLHAKASWLKAPQSIRIQNS
jgi:HTH-type transcriptional regulator/antitoxin HipB